METSLHKMITNLWLQTWLCSWVYACSHTTWALLPNSLLKLSRLIACKVSSISGRLSTSITFRTLMKNWYIRLSNTSTPTCQASIMTSFTKRLVLPDRTKTLKKFYSCWLPLCEASCPYSYIEMLSTRYLSCKVETPCFTLSIWKSLNLWSSSARPFCSSVGQ